MGKYVVMQKQWKKVMGTEPWKGKKYVGDGDNYPATYISWDDCQEFVNRLNSSFVQKDEDGWKYRLPTSDEWGYACGEDYDLYELGEYAWYFGNTVGEEYAHEVGLKKPNKWGLYDMHGNVWEWTETKDGSDRVCRGGSWDGPADYCESSDRIWLTPDFRGFNLGVRLVRERL